MQRVVKPVINGRVLAFLAILSTAMAILVFGLTYWLASSDIGRELRFPWMFVQVLLLAFAVLFVVFAIWSTWGAWSWLRLERRRQTTAHGSRVHTFLATEQPSPRTVPLSLPVIISVRPKWTMKLIAWPLAALIAITSAGAAFDHGIWDIRFFAAVLGALGGGSFVLLHLTGEQQIEVTDDQLTVRAGGFEETVPWEEARLFAVTHGRHASLTYELSSSQARAPWRWVRPDTFSARLYEPTISQYEYDRQMEALLALVAAKTGLPLYDLR